MKKNYFGAYAHLALLVLLATGLFSACTKSEKFATQPNHNNLSGANAAIINQVIPNGSTTVSFDSISKDDESALTKMETTNTIVILNHGITTAADKKFIHSVVYNHSIPVILDGGAALNNNTISGISNIPGNSIALLYNGIGEGITTEIFNDNNFGTAKAISVTPALDPKRFVLTPSQKAEFTKEALQKNPSLNIDSAWKEYNKNIAALLAQRTKNDTTAVSETAIPGVPLTSQVEEIKSRFLECLSNVYKKQNSNVASSAHVLDATTPNLDDYKIKGYHYDLVEAGTSNKSTFTSDGKLSVPTNNFVPFTYRVFVTVAEGTYKAETEVRTFVNVTFVGNPGVVAMVQDGDNQTFGHIISQLSFVQQRSILNTMMSLFQPEIDFPSTFDYDNYQPSASSVSTGTVTTNTAFSFILNPLGGRSALAFSYTLEKSYSYSVPSFGFTNQTSTSTTKFPAETDAYKIIQWPFTPGNCVNGAFANGAGMLESFVTVGSDVFYPANQAPVPMNQTNNISVSVDFSKTYDGNNFDLFCYITTNQINALGEATLFENIVGRPYLKSNLVYLPIAKLAGTFKTSFE